MILIYPRVIFMFIFCFHVGWWNQGESISSTQGRDQENHNAIQKRKGPTRNPQQYQGR